jgi:hypothetical protein
MGGDAGPSGEQRYIGRGVRKLAGLLRAWQTQCRLEGEGSAWRRPTWEAILVEVFDAPRGFVAFASFRS